VRNARFNRDDGCVPTGTMSLLSFSGFLRFNEAAKLRRSELRIESDHLQVFITKSKTDQYGATGKESCPVKMLIDYLKLAGIVDSSNEFIFRNMALSGKMAQNAFFCENELLSFSCTLLSLEHTNSNFFQNGPFLTENQLFL